MGGKPGDEAFTCVAPLIGARLVGMDPRRLHGFDFIQAAKGWFDPQRGVYRHSRLERGQAVYHAGIYGYWAGIQGLVLAAQYPDDPELRRQARSAVEAFLRIAQGMGCPANANFDVLGFDFDKDWKDRWDPQCLLFYEALTSWDWGRQGKFRPYATGDPIRLGWGVPKIGPQDYYAEKRRWFANSGHNLALYMGNHVGFLGGVMALTDVPGILRRDCLATDWFHAPAYPTWPCYNPHPEAKTFHTDVGPAPVDLYDVLQHDFVRRAVRGRIHLRLPPDAAAVIVAAPAGGKLTRAGKRTLIETVEVDFGDQTD